MFTSTVSLCLKLLFQHEAWFKSWFSSLAVVWMQIVTGVTGCADLSPVTGSVALRVTLSRQTSSVTSKKKTLSRYRRVRQVGTRDIVQRCVCVSVVV